MSQFEPTIDLPVAAPPARIRGWFRVPGWMLLCCTTGSRALGRHVRLRDPHRDHRAADLGCSSDRLRPLRRTPGTVMELSVRDDRPGQRHLLAGRRRRAPLAAPRRSGRSARDHRSPRSAESPPPTPEGSSTRASICSSTCSWSSQRSRCWSSCPPTCPTGAWGRWPSCSRSSSGPSRRASYAGRR